MAEAIIITFLNLFVPVFSGILILRVLLSYMVQPGNRFMEWLIAITEPVLAPVRKILPAAGGLDFAPLVVILLLQGLQTLLGSLLPG